MRILHMTDVHFYRPPGLGAALGKRTLGLVNLHGLGRRHHFDADGVVPLAIADALEHAPDLFLMTGDMTALASEAEFVAARQAFEPLLSGLPSVVVPGNHDLYTMGAKRDARMERHFGPFMGGGIWDEQGRVWTGGWSAAAAGESVPWPVRFRIGSVDVIATNPCKPGLRASGRFGPGAILRAEGLVESGRADGQHVVYMLHYPVMGPDGLPYQQPGHSLQDLPELLESLRRAPPDLILHGHKHIAYRGSLRVDGSRAVPILGCGSSSAASSLPDRTAGFYLVDFDEQGISAVTRRRLDLESRGFVAFPELSGPV
jgi:3',5'-cyclic AMP phosphodiesterase CpdA